MAFEGPFFNPGLWSISDMRATKVGHETSTCLITLQGSSRSSREPPRIARIRLVSIRAFSRLFAANLRPIVACRLLRAYAELHEHKRVIESNFLQVVISARRSAVARGHVGLQQQYVFISLERP